MSERADLLLPQLGETVTEGTILRWFKGVGDPVTVGEMLYEVSTDKVDSEVPSPMEGTIAEIRVPEGETVDVGAVLAVVELAPGASAPAPGAELEMLAAAGGAVGSDAGASAPAQAPPEPAPLPTAAQSAAPPPAAQRPAPSAPQAPRNLGPSKAGEPYTTVTTPETSQPLNGGLVLSPVVRRLIREHNLDASTLRGTGVGGRITRLDVLNEIDERQRGAIEQDARRRADQQTASEQPTAQPSAGQPVTPAPETTSPAERPQVPASVAASAAADWTDGDSRYEFFNSVRRRTGAHMVKSVATSPHALTVVEVDYENVEQVRREHKAAWRAAEGFSLTYLPFIVAAVADALAHWPRLNASVEGDGLRLWRRRNIGVAVDLDYDGLIVPVLRDVDSLSLRGVARTMNELAERARQRRLSPDDVTGGTFTISNNGSFGTYTTAAIINQPQVAVLSTDGVARRPVVVADEFGNESLAIHSMGHLAMGWDHRAFDGSYAAGFLSHVRQMLEGHDWGAEF